MTDSCSRGALELLAPDGETISRLFTIEKPFIAAASGGKAGEPFRSCIGPGVYTLSPFTRPNEDKVWVLSNPDLDVFKLDTDVPPGRQGKGRFLILIHAGNRARDVVGCIAPGLSHRKDADGTLMVTSSRDAMKVLHKALDGRRNLEIEIGNDPAVRVAPMVARPVAAAAHPLVSEPTPNLHNWLRVPQGSRLVIRLSGTTTKELVTGSGSIRSDKAASRVFSDAEVQPGPLVVQLNGQDSCSVLLNLQFPRRATAAVSAFVEAPDHTHVPVDYHEQFRRPQGSAETILFNVITV